MRRSLRPPERAGNRFTLISDGREFFARKHATFGARDLAERNRARLCVADVDLVF